MAELKDAQQQEMDSGLEPGFPEALPPYYLSGFPCQSTVLSRPRIREPLHEGRSCVHLPLYTQCPRQTFVGKKN